MGNHNLPSKGIAAVLSFLIPGLGQIYCGRLLRGLIWLIFVIGGYAMLIVPGIILHIFCILDALSLPDRMIPK